MGRKLTLRIPVRTVSKEYVDSNIETTVDDSMTAHKFATDPHPQYTTDAEAAAIAQASAPRFVTHWKWS